MVVVVVVGIVVSPSGWGGAGGVDGCTAVVEVLRCGISRGQAHLGVRSLPPSA